MTIHRPQHRWVTAASRPVAWFLISLLLTSCDEHLPLRSDPSALIRGSTDAEYLLTVQQNVVLLRFTLVNTYDEVIEGTSAIDGTIVLSLVRDPSVTKTFSLSGAQVRYARDFNPATQFLRVAPGDSIVFTASFNFIDDSGRDLFEYLPFSDDPSCPGRLVSHRETYILRAEADIFPRVATVVASPLLVDLCIAKLFVPPNVCTPVTGATSSCLDSFDGR